MKFFASQIAFFLQKKTVRTNSALIFKFLLVLIFLIALFSSLFHYIMEMEGQSHSWLTGIYWTLTVMTTLGFGDITFHSDIGRAFSIIVLISGLVFLVVLLPFTFIQFFYAPWMAVQAQARAPRQLSQNKKGHVILTNFNDITTALIEKLNSFHIDYVILIEDLKKALDLYDMGYKVAVGFLDDPETYRKMRIDKASLVVAQINDEVNTNISYTVRELNDKIPIISIADSPDSVDILKLAGSSHIIELNKILGAGLARRALGGGAFAHSIGSVGDMIIAEAPAMGTPLIGKSIMQSELREHTGVTIIGLWEHGNFILPDARSEINTSTVLVIAGTEGMIQKYNDMFSSYQVSDKPVIVLGSGRVGSAVIEVLARRRIEYRVIEKDNLVVVDPERTITGNAADLDVLKQAGIDEAPAVIITTNNDSTNIFISIYCRRLRPDIHIISRANNERNVSTLHRAGADLVLSFSSLGANTIFNYLLKNNVLMLTEGLDIFRHVVPQELIGKSLAQSRIRESTGCNVLAIQTEKELIKNPDPFLPLPEKAELILIGTIDSEKVFAAKFGNNYGK